ncbi:MAG TPA: cysteine peptidase family C39 domain-containing protein [Chthonomonadaceae bacterium]|nr:cysteine peptidase family C39 domain-containing protein [Chthonomonadaceae bacterium]
MAALPRSFLRALTLSGVVVTLSGCRSSSVAVHTPVQAPAYRDPHQAAVMHIQSLPLYHQAQAACQQHQYRKAADLLDQLAGLPGINDLEREFCHEQRSLCLEDAAPQRLPSSIAIAPPRSPADRNTVQKAQRAKTGAPVASVEPLSSASGAADCGPRALLLVCEQLGIPAQLDTLRQKAGTNATGTSLQGLAQAAQAVGLKAQGVQLSREAFSEAQMPALAWVNGNHFVAVLAITGSGESGVARIHDPNQSEAETISQERLLRLCSGYLLLIRR